MAWKEFGLCRSVDHVEASGARERAATTIACPLYHGIVTFQAHHHLVEVGPVDPFLQCTTLVHINVIKLIVTGGHLSERECQGLGISHFDYPLALLSRAICLEWDGTECMHPPFDDPRLCSQGRICLASLWSKEKITPRQLRFRAM